MIDLFNNKYSRKILKENIYSVKLIDILKTQKLDATFIVRYILNKKYQLHPDDLSITPTIVLFHQPHISKKNLEIQMMNYESDDDSIDDFETVSNKLSI
jgi:HJR/Mrr/RecB family endonuclease